MAWVVTAIVGGGLLAGAGALGGAALQGSAAERAGRRQAESYEKGIEEQRRQAAATAARLAPYEEAGRGAMQAQQALMGLLGPEAQQAAIAQIQGSPEFAAMARQGEMGITQNASATGGLRGGNTQAALAQFRPQLLSQLIQQRMAALGGLTSMGQASAAGTAQMGQQSAANIANLLGQQGAAQAGAIAGQGRAWGQALGTLGGLGGTIMGAGLMGAFGGAGGGGGGGYSAEDEAIIQNLANRGLGAA